MVLLKIWHFLSVYYIWHFPANRVGKSMHDEIHWRTNQRNVTTIKTTASVPLVAKLNNYQTFLATSTNYTVQ